MTTNLSIEEQEAILEQVNSLLDNNYKPHKYCYAVISDVSRKGEFYETGSCEDFCQNCIDEAIIRYRNRHYRERQHIIDKYDSLLTHGYFYDYPWIRKKDGSLGDRRYKRKRLLPKDVNLSQILSSRRYELKEYRLGTRFKSECFDPDGCGGLTDTKNCDGCGEMFDVYFYPNDQTMEHWESNYVEEDFKNLDCDSLKFELSRLFDGYRWCDEDIKPRMIALAKTIINAQKEIS